jgi:hypothetical protein
MPVQGAAADLGGSAQDLAIYFFAIPISQQK